MTPYSSSYKKSSDGIRTKKGSGRDSHVLVPRAHAQDSAPVQAVTPEPVDTAAVHDGIIITDEGGQTETVMPLEPAFPYPAPALEQTFFSRARHAFPPLEQRKKKSSVTAVQRLKRLGAFSGISAIVIIVILLSTVWARLTVTLKPRVDSIAIEDVAAHFDIGTLKVLPDEKSIPAERLMFSQTMKKEFDATGKEDIAVRARGKVKIYNRFSSSPQPLVKNTRFLTAAGIIFRLAQSLTIPGAKIEQGKIIPQFIETELSADAPGEKFNISGEVTLVIPGFKGSPRYDGFYAVSSQGFAGGVRGERTIVSKEDSTRAQETVTKQLFDALREQMAHQIPAGLRAKDQLREIQIIALESPRPHTPGDRFWVEATARGRMMAFREADVLTLIDTLVLKNDTSKKLIPDPAALEYQVSSIDFDAGRADVIIRGSVKTKIVIQEAVFGSVIAGKKQGSILEILKNRSELSGFSMTIFPPWRASAPRDPSRIRFIIQEP